MYGTLFFHQEKSFHDHCLSRVSASCESSSERACTSEGPYQVRLRPSTSATRRPVAVPAAGGDARVVADPPGGVGDRYAPHPKGYLHAADLVAGIKRIADVEVSVSAYPEKHPDSPDVGSIRRCTRASGCRCWRPWRVAAQ